MAKSDGAEDLLARPSRYLLTTSQVAEILARTPVSVRKMAASGTLKPCMASRNYFFTVGEVLRYLENQQLFRRGRDDE